MLRSNKFRVAVSSAVILLPVLFVLLVWNDLFDTMGTPWGREGHAGGWRAKVFVVLGLPSALLVSHLVCLLLTFRDKKQKEQSPKVLGTVFWIIPVISLSVSGILYRIALGRAFDYALFLPVPLGAALVFIGNYFPKVKPNRTLGIKVPWTLNNEENWNKTHRLGGKVWVAGGFIVLFSALLPLKLTVWITVCTAAAAVMIPIAYSYWIYRHHRMEGVVYAASPKSAAEKIARRVTAVVVPLIFAGIAILLFTGDIVVRCGDSSFRIDASYWTDIEADYSQIDTVEYREDLDVGVRTAGFGSLRLLMGNFQNDEFGSYTLYAYTGARAFIVLASDTPS